MDSEFESILKVNLQLILKSSDILELYFVVIWSHKPSMKPGKPFANSSCCICKIPFSDKTAAQHCKFCLINQSFRDNSDIVTDVSKKKYLCCLAFT